MCRSELIPRNVERGVKDAKNVDVSIVLHEICDTVMPIKQNPDISRRSKVAMSDLGETGESLRALIDFLNSASGGVGIIVGDVLEVSSSQRWASSVHAIVAMRGCGAPSAHLRWCVSRPYRPARAQS